MANLPFERPTSRPFVNGSTNSSVNSFSNFQFKTIGKGPALLQRISAPDPSAQIADDMALSPISSPDPNKFIPADVPAETSGTINPSLQERLSMFDSSGNMDTRVPAAGEVRHSSRTSVIVNSSSSQPVSSVGGARVSASQMPPANVNPPTTSKVPGSPNNHEATLPSPVSPSSSIPPESAHTPAPSQNGISAVSNSALGPTMQQHSADDDSTSSSASASGEASLDSLTVIQTSLATALANFNAVSNTPAMRAAQATQDQCAEVLSAAQRANELAEQALDSAQRSRAAARQCLSVAESIQSRTDDFMTALESIKSAQEPVLSTIQDVSQQLQQWASDKRAHEARIQQELEEKMAELHHQRMATRLRSANSTRIGLAAASSSGDNQHQSIARAVDGAVSVPLLVPSVEYELDPATRAWSQILEQRRVEHKRQFEEDQRKRREAEELLEQETRKAQAEVEAREAALARARAERIKAEERERQEEEEREAQLKAQQYRYIEEARQRLIAQRGASEEPLRNVKDKQQADFMQKEKASFLHAQADLEKNQAFRKSPNSLNNAKLRERLEAERASAQGLKELQESQPKDKQVISSSLPPNSTDTTSASFLPVLPSSHVVPPMNTAPHDFGNVVSKKTLLTASPGSDRKQNKLVSGNVPVARVPCVPPPTLSQPAPIPTSLASSRSSMTSNTSTNATRQVPSSLPPKLARNPIPTRSAVHSNGINPRNVNTESVVETPSPAVYPPQGPNGHISTSHSTDMSLPGRDDSPIPGLSDFPIRSMSQASVVPADVSVNAMGSDLGNAMLVRRPRVPPVSPDAQKANLRGLMDANAAPEHKSIKREADEEKPVLRPEGGNTKSAKNIGLPRKALKNEPQDDIPLLALPSPPNSRSSPPTSTVVPPALSAIFSRPQLSERRRQEKTFIAGRPSEQTVAAGKFVNGRTLVTIGRPQQTGFSIVGPPAYVPAPVQALARPPSNITPSLFPSRSAPEIVSRASAANGFDDSSRMGPDASITVGWSQPNLMEEELPPSRPRSRAGPPPMVLDHYSPSPPPYPSGNYSNRGPPPRNPPRKRPRKPVRVDHYSPERSRFSPPSSRSRSASGNNSRAVSPNQRYGPMHPARPRSPDRVPSPVAGQKRGRDEQEVAGPSNRRTRYEEPQLRPHPSELGSAAPYASTGYRYQEEWSHTAAYARSPSPALPPQPPAPLAERIAGQPDARPAARERPPPRRHPNVSHPPTHGSGPSPARQGYRGTRNDTRPPLLDRFTDSRAQRPNQRYGPPLPLEDRIAGKNSLIDRLM